MLWQPNNNSEKWVENQDATYHNKQQLAELFNRYFPRFSCGEKKKHTHRGEKISSYYTKQKKIMKLFEDFTQNSHTQKNGLLNY